MNFYFAISLTITFISMITYIVLSVRMKEPNIVRLLGSSAYILYGLTLICMTLVSTKLMRILLPDIPIELANICGIIFHIASFITLPAPVIVAAIRIKRVKSDTKE